MTSWKDVIASKDQGALQVESLKSFNLALLTKWWWRLKTNNHSLWVEVIRSFHGYKRNLVVDPLLSKKAGIWGSISKIPKDMAALQVNLPAAFHRESPPGQTNTWRWSLEPSGYYSVSSLRKKLDSILLHNDRNLKTSWLKIVPSKVNIAVWKIQHRRLPTFSNLARRGIIPDVKSCPLCSIEPETEDHLLMGYPFSQSLLREIGSWWSLNIPAGPIESLLNWGVNSNFKGVKLKAFISIIYTFCWLIWKARNEVVHGGEKVPIHRVLLQLQGIPYFWLHHRGDCNFKFSWQSWCSFPHFIFPL